MLIKGICFTEVNLNELTFISQFDMSGDGCSTKTCEGGNGDCGCGCGR